LKQSFEGTLRQIPLIRAIIPFIAGILVASSLQVSFPLLHLYFFAVIVCLLLIIVHLLVQSNRNMLVWFGAIVYAAFFVLGFVITTQQKQQYTPLTNNVKYMLVAHIADVPIQKEKTRKLVLDVFQIANGTQWTKTKAKVLAYIANDSASQKLCMGDIIEVTAYANPIETFKTNGKFDYPLFMARKHICNQMYIPNYAWKLVGKDSLWSVRAFSLQVSSKIHNIYTACKLQPEESAVLNALM